jgi:hypothetical protein
VLHVSTGSKGSNTQPEGQSIVAAVVNGAGGWCWLEMTFPQGKGKLMLCGFALIEGWDAGPTPRFLFARLLELLSPSGAAGTKREEPPLGKNGAFNNEE